MDPPTIRLKADLRQLWSQIPPSRIHALDNRDLLFAPPNLELLFSRNWLQRIRERLEIDESINVVARCEASLFTDLVLGKPPLHVVARSDIKCAGETR